MIGGILIDLDDTLIDDRFATEQAVCLFSAEHLRDSGEPPSAISARWLESTERHWRRFRTGQTTFLEQRRARLSEFLDRSLTSVEADGLFADYLHHYEKCWRLTLDAPRFLALTSHIPKVIVSNGEAAQVAKKVEALRLSLHVLAVVTPETAGAPKPKPEIFLHALRMLRISAADCLMIGNSHEYDIAPAKALGMSAFHVGTGSGGTLLEAANFCLSRTTTLAPRKPAP